MSEVVGKAHVFKPHELTKVLRAIESNRHPEKNLCIVLLSFSLGLRAQEIALLENQFLLDIDDQYPAGFKVKDELRLPRRVTKGARATKPEIEPEKMTPVELREGRRSVRYSLAEFDNIIKQVTSDARLHEGKLEPTDYYPERKVKKGKTRELALEDPLLRQAIYNYTMVKMGNAQRLYKKGPFLVSQKDTAYSPNSMQRHMATIYRKWAGIPNARSHSGRRTLATKLLKYNKEPVEVVQEILGHADPSTTIIYQIEPTSGEKRAALAKGRINRS